MDNLTLLPRILSAALDWRAKSTRRAAMTRASLTLILAALFVAQTLFLWGYLETL